MQIKKNDTVLVTAGKEKGKRGRVIAVYPKENRVLIEKLNMIKRHTRPNQQLRQGGIVEKEGSINLSNVQLWCEKCAAPRRSGIKWNEQGGKLRVCKKCGNEFPQQAM